MGDQDTFDPVKWFEKCATQILLAHRLMDDDSLKLCLQKLCIDRPQCRQTASKPLSDLFTRLNNKLRLYGMEVKTVAIKVDGVLTYYHGVANTEEDAVAKDYGSSYDAVEVKFFTTLCQEIVAKKFMHTNDACKVSPWGESGCKVDSRVQELLSRFEDDKWLKRDGRGYFELGLRAYLELSTYIKDLVTALAEDDEDEDGDDEEKGTKEDKDGEEQENNEINTSSSQNQSSSSSSSSSSIDAAKNKKVTKRITRMTTNDIPQLIIY